MVPKAPETALHDVDSVPKGDVHSAIATVAVHKEDLLRPAFQVLQDALHVVGFIKRDHHDGDGRSKAFRPRPNVGSSAHTSHAFRSLLASISAKQSKL